MQRGLPVSIFVHIFAIVMVFVFGNKVSRPPLLLPHTLDLEFALVSLPNDEPVKEAEPEPDPVVPIIAPEVEDEPAVVPEKPKDIPEEKVVKQTPEPVKEVVKQDVPPRDDQIPAKEPEPDLPPPALTGFGVAGTDVDFPFAYYLGLVKARISRHFNPTRLGFRDNSVISCVMHFTVARNGSISQVNVEHSSGVDVFDREARRAVLAAHPLPKLPPKFNSSTLGITFVFNLESGL